MNEQVAQEIRIEPLQEITSVNTNDLLLMLGDKDVIIYQKSKTIEHLQELLMSARRQIDYLEKENCALGMLKKS